MKVTKTKRTEKVMVEKEVEEISMVLSMEDAEKLARLLGPTTSGMFWQMYDELTNCLSPEMVKILENKKLADEFLLSVGLKRATT